MLNRIAVVLGVVLFVAGCRTVEPPPPPEAPRISSFTASKTRIASGEEVTLSFTTSGAEKVEVMDDQGRDVALSGTASEGSGVVAPARSAFYVLRATGAGGRDSAFVQIAVNEPIKELFLIAVPQVIDSGEQAQLLWGAPGASSVTLKTGSEAPRLLTGTTGTALVSPQTTEEYLLTAVGAANTPPVTALARVQVRPVLSAAALSAEQGYLAGETLRFTWTTAGATAITVSERTFGQLERVTNAGAVAQGFFDYELPAQLPNGVALSDGLPLRFTIEASAGDLTVRKEFRATVGGLPVFESFDAPEFATVGQTMTIRWTTTNATRLTLLSGTLPVFSTLPTETARVENGTLTLPAPHTRTQFTLVAENELGAVARRAFSVEPVAIPVINTFTLTPTINAFGDPATARWTTAQATRVVVRLEDGSTLGMITTPAQVANGSFSFTPATNVRVTLEAYNAAGAKVSQTRASSLGGGLVTVTPTPVVRGGTVTLDWSLAPTVTEVVGLATPRPPPVTSSTAFVDLAMAAEAEQIVITDFTSGSQQLTYPPGFVFPLLGSVPAPLFVSVEGYLSLTRAAVTGSNADIGSSSNSSPTLIAPFWDDLTAGPNSKLFSGLQTAANGERFLAVQWDKFLLASDPNSELTFQVHLYETGQVSFVYKTMTGTLTSATIGIKVAELGVAQVFSHNGTPAPVAADLELKFFTEGPATGSVSFPAAASKHVQFFGRSAGGLIPASAELRTFGQNELIINEVMARPEPSVATTGQWVELRNALDASVNLEGLVLRATGSTDGGFVIPSGTVMTPGGYLVLGQSTDTALNGGARVDLAYEDVPLALQDSVSLNVGSTAIARFAYDGGADGQSSQPLDILVASGQGSGCQRTRTQTFGPAGAIGTPGAVNESCAPYVLSSIPGGFLAAPPTATALTLLATGTTFAALDEGAARFTLGTPFPYWGTPETSVNVAANGFLTFGAALTDGHYTNNTAVSTSAPNAVIAPFWDDLQAVDASSLFQWRLSDRTVISWQNWEIAYSTTANLNFQVHLIDDGTIEMHYGTMASTSSTQQTRLTGDSATIWVERQDGVLAVPHSINRANSVLPNSGIRFTPVP